MRWVWPGGSAYHFRSRCVAMCMCGFLMKCSRLGDSARSDYGGSVKGDVLMLVVQRIVEMMRRGTSWSNLIT